MHLPPPSRSRPLHAQSAINALTATLENGQRNNPGSSVSKAKRDTLALYIQRLISLRQQKTAMKQAVGYIRVSTEEQGKSGFGLQSQKATIHAVAKATDTSSGPSTRKSSSAISTSTDERPKLQEAIQASRRRRCPLIVARLDRLSRDAIEIETIVTESRIEIIDAVVGHNADSAVIQAEAARIAEETKMLSERTRAGILRAKQQGKVFGNPRNLPEAQKKGAAATKRNAEIRDAEISSIILRSRGRPLSEVAAELNRAGLRAARVSLGPRPIYAARATELSGLRRNESRTNWRTWKARTGASFRAGLCSRYGPVLRRGPPSGSITQRSARVTAGDIL